MKSDEEFIAGIYAKAKAYQSEYAKREDNNVVYITSYQRRIKKVSKYAAGVAACLACGFAVYLGANINKDSNDNSDFIEGRGAWRHEGIQPMAIKSNSGNEGIISEQDEYNYYLHCMIVGIFEQNGINSIDAVVDGGNHVTLFVPAESKSKLIEVGNEIVLSVSEVDSLGNYSIKSAQEIYLYSGIENGEKIFTSEDHSVLREGDFKTTK